MNEVMRMKKVGQCTLHATRSKSKDKIYTKYMVWLPKVVGTQFEKGTKFEVLLDGKNIILSCEGDKVLLKDELYQALLGLFIKAFRDPLLNSFLKEKFSDDVALIVNILKRMKGGE